MNNRVDDVLTKMKALKDQIKQMSEDQGQVIDILKSIAEKQVRYINKTVIFSMTLKRKISYQIRLNNISLIIEILFIQDIDIDKKEDNSHYFSTIEPDL